MLVRRAANAVLASDGTATGPGSFHLQDVASGMTVDVALQGVTPSAAGQPQPDGSVIYPGAYNGADLIERSTPDGVEDSISFASAPATAQVDYDVTLDTGVAGLRLISDSLEFLDAGGAPRLRVSPPYLVDATGQIVAASVSVDGCATDQDPRPPWDRPTVDPGATICVMHVSWAGATLAYPAVLDPSWTTTANMTSARIGHVAAWIPGGAVGRVLVAGGATNLSNNSAKSAEYYDPSSATWAGAGSMSADRVYATATVLADGRVLIVGGLQKGQQNALNSVAAVDIFTPNATTPPGTWVTGPSLGTARHQHAAVLLGDGRVLVAGGYKVVQPKGGSTTYSLVGSYEIYTPESGGAGSWSTAQTIAPLAELTLTKRADGKVVAAGGCSSVDASTGACTAATNASSIFDPGTNGWTSAAPMATARRGHVAALLRDGTSILVAGGSGVSAAEVYSASSWTSVAAMSTPRYAGTASLLKNGQVLVAGGSSDGTAGGAQISTQLFDPGTSTWAAAPGMNVGRYAHTATLLSDGRIVAAGGGTTNGATSSATPTVELFSGTLGLACHWASDCDSGYCTDGVCCNVACGDPCQACDVSGSVGTCTAVTGAPHGTRGPCASDGSVCGGTCDGNDTASCAYPATSTSCGSASCTGGTQTFAGSCNGSGACSAGQPKACSPYVCGATACLTQCGTMSDCDAQAANYCTSAGQCVMDTTPPVLSLPAAMAVEATSASGAIVAFTATAQDNYAGTVPVTCTPNSGATFAFGTTTVNCSASDPAGNQAKGSFTVAIRDTTPPSLSGMPSNITAEATGPGGATVSWVAPTATDVVDGAVTASCAPASGDLFPLGTTTVTCTATDAHGNTGSATFAVKVQDTTPPVFQTAQAPIIAEATGPAGAAVTWPAPVASDLVDGVVPVACTPLSGSIFSLASTLVGCTATDKSGNQSFQSFFVTVQDTTPPSLILPADITAEATGPDGAPVSYAATANDLVDGPVTPSCIPASGSTFPLGSTAVDCTATDAHGNVAHGSFTVTVQDTTPPELTLPSDTVAEATGPAGAAVTFAATAYDLVDGDVSSTVVCSPASDSTFPLGSTTVSCSAVDMHGNMATGTFRVIVQDTTPPTLTLPKSITAQSTESDGSAKVSFIPAPSATDLVDGSVEVKCDPASGSLFPLDTDSTSPTTVTCTATDAHQNTATGTFTITVETNAPSNLILPSNPFYAEAANGIGQQVDFTTPANPPSPAVPSATDGDGKAIPVTCDPASNGFFQFDLPTSVSCWATDAERNTAIGNFRVLVRDTTPPVISGTPAPITAEATGPSGAAVSWSSPTATDLVDGPRPVTCSPSSGGTFPLGKTTVTCSSSDTHGNTSNSTFTVTVQDTTPPTITVPGTVNAVATSAAGATVTYPAASAYDLVSGTVTPSCTPASGTVFKPGSSAVTCTAIDGAGNMTSASFTVTVTFGWGGFLPPVTLDGRSLFKYGSTVPVKFALSGASAGITNLNAQLFVAQVSNGALGDELQATSTSAADSGNTFRYDPTNGSYVFNLASKSLAPNSTWQLVADLHDGHPWSVAISIR